MDTLQYLTSLGDAEGVSVFVYTINACEDVLYLFAYV